MFKGIRAEVKRPATAIAVIIAVITTLVSVLLYLKSIKAGAIYYQVQQVQVFDQTTLSSKATDPQSPLYVVDEQGNRINDNIYAANVKIWNGGNDEVRIDDVRVPLTLRVVGNAKLVAASISYTTSDNVDHFALENQSSQILLLWKHFDKVEGFTVRIVYAAKEQYPILIYGRAANTAGPIDIDIYQKRRITLFTRAGDVFLTIVASSLMTLVSFRFARYGRVNRLELVGFSLRFGLFSLVVLAIFTGILAALAYFVLLVMNSLFEVSTPPY